MKSDARKHIPYVSEALEEQTAALAYILKAQADPDVRRVIRPQERTQWFTDLHCLSRAAPFFWSGRTVELVTTLMPDFQLSEIRASRNLVPTDVAWHWFSDRVPFEIEEWQTRRMLPVRAISWYFFGVSGKPYLGMTAWARHGLRPDGTFGGACGPVLWACVDENAVMSSQIEDDRLNFRGFSDDRTEWEVLQMKLFVVASATFLRQELLITTKERAGRQVRKRAEETLKRPASDIRVIQLRRTKTSSQKLPQAGEAKPPVDWQWQWSVRGHVRQQFYRSLNEHLPVYIHEHMKGPEDKPIKPRSTPIFSVTR